MSELFSSYGIPLTAIVHEIGHAMCVGDKNYTILAANDIFAKWYGKTCDEILGKNVFDLNPDFKNSVFYEAALHTLETGQPTTRIGYSTVFNKWLVVRTCKLQEDVIWYAHELKTSFDKVAYSGNYDSLTSLYNRFTFEDDMNQIYNLKQEFGLILIDINKFRELNESLGFAFGDMCLMETAARLKQHIQHNKIYRLGSDQFAIIFQTDKEYCISAINEIFTLFKKPYVINHEQFMLSASIGFVYLTRFDGNPTDVISNAEFVLNQAKKINNYYVEYNENQVRTTTKMLIAKELKQSLTNSQLALYYQPQIDTTNGKVCGAEALLRWLHPTKGIISPLDFLNIAEEYDMMQEIDRFVIKQAIKDIQEFIDADIALPISINFSSKTICNLETVDFIDQCLAESKIDPKLLLIEITENSLMEDLAKSKIVLGELSKRDIKIAIDDFGTGYSSMGYLVRYPTNYLKIDKEFITEINQSNTLQIMTGNLIKLGHSLCMTVVAEGVETLEEFNLLKGYDCDIIQGYFFSKPIPRSQFIPFVRKYGISQLKTSN